MTDKNDDTVAITRRLRITGHVQGVGYRWHTVQEARRLGLVGWVRNCHDGSVEVFAQGPADKVAALVAWCRQGPRLARVDRVVESDAAIDDALATFEIAPDA